MAEAINYNRRWHGRFHSKNKLATLAVGLSATAGLLVLVGPKIPAALVVVVISVRLMVAT